ncbi:Cof-type HAD-IIB family hydrolase [Leuconostoc citreum]|uniref:Cof-type HAD-IIB family hydrolase n=1 Tax=Leuconostoc citreum TaxID=33964 RepID=UPI00209DAF22|nr:Cof-type HAD-IIB family hydrolase [Leuconostoc citreum]MCP1276498.1 Cof-type HAD-IIB family hydrolase [Leuconostoc citreum]
MTTIKLIALDLDNTLLLPDKKLSHRNKCILQTLHHHHIKIVLTTGRPLPNTKPILDQLNFTEKDDYVILFNGGLIKNLSNNNILLNKYFSIKNIQHILLILKSLSLPIDLVTQNHVYSIKEYGQSAYSQLISRSLPYSQINLSVLNTHTNFQFNKFVVCATSEQLSHLEKILSNSPLTNNQFNFVRSRRTLLEFIPKNVNKALALNVLLEHLSLTPDNLMAFGDEENDIEMIKLARIGVAMGNAIPKVKAVADFQTLDNVHDGVSEFLESYFRNITLDQHKKAPE